MGTIQQILFLLQKEFKLEFRQKYAISGILLYIFSTIFVVYMGTASRAESPIWIVLFFIIVLFTSVNAVAKSFVQESGNRQLYYYSIANPTAIIISKMIYNTLLLLFLSFLALGVFSLIMDYPILDSTFFFIVLFLASVGLSITFTFISAISSKADNSAPLTAILGFPVIIPILIVILKLASESLNVRTSSIFSDAGIMEYVWTLIAIDILLAGVSLLLFPYLWRD